jgi:hypothetical protein
MMATKLSKARPAKFPDGLLTAGKSLWKSVTDEYELDVHESLLLLQSCRCVDRLDQMAEVLASAPLTLTNFKGDEVAHPLIAESRQQSLTLSRLLASLRLPSGDESRPQRRGASRGAYGIRGAV